MTLAPDTPELRKARGAFFTPPGLCRYVAEWAIRDRHDRVLEPSCGEAAFLVAAAERLRRLGSSAPALFGHELHGESAAAAHGYLARAGHAAEIQVGDFFAATPQATYAAVIGNPPYVRYQQFAGEARALAREAALRGGVALTALASSWAAFTVHASLFLSTGGRLGLVVPAELLSVNYAAGVRRFLLERFGRVRLVAFTERVFPGVQEEVLLLLAEGTGPTSEFELVQARNVDHLLTTGGITTTWRPGTGGEKWTPALLPAAALDAFAHAQQQSAITTLSAWGDTTLGGVTGNNAFFALRASHVRELGLPHSELVPVSPPGSRHLRGLSFTRTQWSRLAERDARSWIFRPGEVPSPAAARYIAQGEREGVNGAYKCRVRRPWWHVPLPPPADLLLTYMNADTPRLTTNAARVHHLNSVHGVYLAPELRTLGRSLLPLASLNTVTLLGAETVGRAYGGGMLKLEPGEADGLPVPDSGLLAATSAALVALRPAVRQALAAGRLLSAVRLVDAVVLSGALGMSGADLSALRDAHIALSERRAARGGS